MMVNRSGPFSGSRPIVAFGHAGPIGRTPELPSAEQSSVASGRELQAQRWPSFPVSLKLGAAMAATATVTFS